MTTEKKLNRDIERTKKKLINKARKNGLWENFGQKEVRKLMDIYSEYANALIRDIIQDFDNWCMNFDLNNLRG